MNVDDVFRLMVPVKGFSEPDWRRMELSKHARNLTAAGVSEEEAASACCWDERTITPGIDLRVLEIGATETRVLITVDFSEWWISNDLMP